MDCVDLYGEKGVIDQKKEKIKFKIPQLPHVFNKIEDQGELNDCFVRKILFKYLDEANNSITLEFKYQDIKQYDPREAMTLQQFQDLLKEAIKKIHYLNKQQYTLLEFKYKNILVTKKDQKGNNQIYFIHFEVDHDKNYRNEVETIKFIMINYIEQCQDENIKNQLKQVENFTQMTQMLNNEFIHTLFANEILVKKKFAEIFSKNKFCEMKEYYEMQEKGQNILQLNYYFPKQFSLSQVQITEVQKEEIEIHLLQIAIIDDILFKYSGLLKQNLVAELYNLKQVLLNNLKTLFERNQKVLPCLRLTLEILQSKIGPTQLQTGILDQDINQCLESIHRKIINQNFDENQGFLMLKQYISLIKHLQSNKQSNKDVCAYIAQELKLPYEKKIVSSQEILMSINSNNIQEILKFFTEQQLVNFQQDQH